MNAISTQQVHSSFARGILSLLDRVEYRRVITAEDLESISRLREKSYLNTDLIDSKSFGSLVDEYDRNFDCHVIGVYIDEKLASTVRLHVVSQSHVHGPTSYYFPVHAERLVQNGGVYVDPSRLATDPDLLWQYPALPLLTLRTAAMASEYFGADYCMSVAGADVSSFYRRSFGALDVEQAKMFPAVSVPLLLMSARIQDIRERITTKFPFFQSTELERRLMFGQTEESKWQSLNILPTAKYAIAQSRAQFEDMAAAF